MIAETFQWVVTEPVVTLLCGTIIPILTGLVTRFEVSSQIKELITIALNAITAMLTTALVGDTAIISGQTIINFLISLALSYASYYGIYKKVGLTSSSPEGKLLPNKGLIKGEKVNE
jgi:hypothetical protein